MSGSRPGHPRLHRRCVVCGIACYAARCQDCEREYQAKRNALPKRQAYKDPAYLAIPLVGQCADCGSAVDLTRHHELAVRYGGTVADGITVVCRSCNAKRG